jgi:GNAT superfamily N-acetyltransferase
MEPQLRIGRAKPTSEHLNAILGLIDEAREWLPAKGTKQWREPWPDRERRDARVWHGLVRKATWVVWEPVRDTAILAATVTVTGKPNPDVWSPDDFDLTEPTVYAHRLITARRYAGWDLGAELIDWAGRRGLRNYGAQSIRIDVWTDNYALHGFYMKRGFVPCGRCRDREYPSGVLLQKPTAKIRYPVNPQFTPAAEVPAVFSAARPDDPGYAPGILAAVHAARLVPETAAGLVPATIGEVRFARQAVPELMAASAG